jgi:hypothetical protein
MNIMADGFEPKTRNQVIDYWHDRYGYNKDIISVAMGIYEATVEGDFKGWWCQGVEEDCIQSFCRILQKMGPSDPKEPVDFRRFWEEA